MIMPPGDPNRKKEKNLQQMGLSANEIIIFLHRPNIQLNYCLFLGFRF